MEREKKYNVRLALLLAVMLVTLVVVSVDQFLAGTQHAETQQAAALRVYAK